jgi:ribosomal protein S8
LRKDLDKKYDEYEIMLRLNCEGVEDDVIYAAKEVFNKNLKFSENLLVGLNNLSSLSFRSNKIILILKYKFDETENKQGSIKIAIKYINDSRLPVIRKMTRVSRPGLRKYVKSTEIPRVINGLGTAVISTSKGVLTDKDARKEKVGGEVLFYIY